MGDSSTHLGQCAAQSDALALPLIAATNCHVPSARLLIVGRQPSPQLIQRAKTTASVILATDVPDVRPFLAVANVAVIPLKVGGGTRLEILEALAARVPVVSSSKGAEGIADNNGLDGILVGDSPSEISQAIISILEDDAKQKNERSPTLLDQIKSPNLAARCFP